MITMHGKIYDEPECGLLVQRYGGPNDGRTWVLVTRLEDGANVFVCEDMEGEFAQMFIPLADEHTVQKYAHLQ
jgi:hypothetical protein